MNIERLVEMVNDIANFFHSEPDHALAVAGIAAHLRRYWEPRMRKQIIAYLRDYRGAGMSDLARAGVEKLAMLEQAAASERPG